MWRNDRGNIRRESFVSIIRGRDLSLLLVVTAMPDISAMFAAPRIVVVSTALPCARTVPRPRGLVINLVVALTADGDHDIRNVGGSGVFVLSANEQSALFHREECVRRRPKSVAPGETSFTRRFLICEPDETVDSS